MNAAARVGLLLLAVPWGLLAVVVIGWLRQRRRRKEGHRGEV